MPFPPSKSPNPSLTAAEVGGERGSYSQWQLARLLSLGSLPITPRLESRHPLSDSPMPPPDGMHRPVALVGGCLSHNPLQISRRHRLNKSCERGEPQPCSPLWAKFTHPLAAAVSTNHPPPPSLPHSRRTTRAVLCHARIGARTWGPPPSPLNAGLHSLFLSCLAALALAWFAW